MQDIITIIWALVILVYVTLAVTVGLTWPYWMMFHNGGCN